MTVKEDSNEYDDPWALVDPPSKGKKWSEKSCFEKLLSIIVIIFLIAVLLGLLYLFVCSLDFLSTAFRLLGGKTAGEAFRANDILTNPIADLMMGVLATVLLQSSSTTTSIVVAMVGSDIMPIRPAIFIVMGANIGTSVTNTIVSLGQVVNKNEFRRAFAGATVHDMFNWLSVLILLPVEWLSGAFGPWNGCGLLCQITEKITAGLEQNDKTLEKQELLKVITKPFTKLIIEIDKKVVTKIATWNITKGPIPDLSLMKLCNEKSEPFIAYKNGTAVIAYNVTKTPSCGYIFEGVVNSWSDTEIGVALLIFALGILIICLVCIVKILHFLLRGKIALIIKKFLNSNIPCGKVGKELTGYLAILIGAGLTMLVQSSSIFTSAMTPLVGVGVLHINRMYPLTLGANIGTTITAILAALAVDSSGFRNSLQIALCHLFFNILGILIWYPLPFMRTVPIRMAKMLGNKTAKYRWFAFVYLFLMFFILPAVIFGLSIAGWPYVLGIVGPIFLFFLIIVLINVCQEKCPRILPSCMHDWSCCPKPLHSLAPYNRLCTICCACKVCKEIDETNKDNDDDLSEVVSVKDVKVANGIGPDTKQEVNGKTNLAYENYEN